MVDITTQKQKPAAESAESDQPTPSASVTPSPSSEVSLEQGTLPSSWERAVASILSETTLPTSTDSMVTLARHGEIKIGETSISVELFTAP